jgi:flagellar basal-body rod modification protein FlgD
MAVDAISGSKSGASDQAAGFSSLSADDFTKLVFTELRNQDPLAPNDTNQLLQQLQSIRSIQSDLDLSTSLKGVANQYEFSGAASLIGKNVKGISETNARAEGVVRSVSRTAQGATITLEDGTRIRMSNLDEVVAQGSSSGPVTPTK